MIKRFNSFFGSVALNTPLRITLNNGTIIHEFGYIENKCTTKRFSNIHNGYVFDESSYLIIIRDNNRVTRSCHIECGDLILKIKSVYKSHRLSKNLCIIAYESN